MGRPSRRRVRSLPPSPRCHLTTARPTIVPFNISDPTNHPPRTLASPRPDTNPAPQAVAQPANQSQRPPPTRPTERMGLIELPDGNPCAHSPAVPVDPGLNVDASAAPPAHAAALYQCQPAIDLDGRVVAHVLISPEIQATCKFLARRTDHLDDSRRSFQAAHACVAFVVCVGTSSVARSPRFQLSGWRPEIPTSEGNAFDETSIDGPQRSTNRVSGLKPSMVATPALDH
jgi:hypothetical protein